MNGINYHVNIPNFHIGNLKHFEYFEILLKFSEKILSFESTVFKHIVKIRILFKCSKKREIKTLFYIMKPKNHKSMIAFFTILTKQQNNL